MRPIQPPLRSRIRGRASPDRRQLLLRLLLPALGLILSAPSCRRSPWRRTLVDSGGGWAIYRETRHDDEGNRLLLGYHHPVTLPEEQVRLILITLGFRNDRVLGKDVVRRLFNESEAERIAGPLSSALETVSPDERIRFFAVRNSGILFLASERATSGVVFSTGPKEVHFAFDLIHDSFHDEGGDPESIVFHGDPIEIEEVANQLIPPPQFTVHGDPDTGKTHPNWIVVDPSKPMPSPPPVLATERAPSRNPRPTPVVGQETPAAGSDSPPAGTGGAFQYRGFNIIKRGGKVYALPISDGPFDPEKAERNEYRNLIAGENLEVVIRAINTWVDSREDSP